MTNINSSKEILDSKPRKNSCFVFDVIKAGHHQLEIILEKSMCPEILV
jgi:hypothetical protein